MKKLVVLFLALTISLSAIKVDIPRDEQLVTFSLKRGIEVWLKTHVSNPPSIACRFISHDPFQGRPQIYDFDCPAHIFESELPSFLEYCEEETQKQGGAPIGLVAVGAIDTQSLKHYLTERYQEQESQENQEEIPYEAIQLIRIPESLDVDLSLSYRTILSPIQTDQDVKKLWAFYLIQSMAEIRFKEAAAAANGEWVGAGETRYFLPAMTTVGRGIERSSHSPEQLGLLSRFLQAIQVLKEKGFSDNELAEAKSRLQKHLKHLYRASPDSIVLADYYASYLGTGLLCPDYGAFMTLSLHLISEIGMNDITEMLTASFRDDTRSVAIRHPEQSRLTKEVVQQTLDNYSSDLIVYQESPKIVLVEGTDAFSQLPVTEEEQRRLRQVIQTVANNNPFQLGLKFSELSKEEAALEHVHPLRALAVFVTDPYTKQCLVKIVKSYFKGSNFINKTSERLRQEGNRSNLLPYVPGFCQAIKANPDQVRAYIHNKDYEGLVKYLIKSKN